MPCPPALLPSSNLGSEHNLSGTLSPLSSSLSQTEALVTSGPRPSKATGIWSVHFSRGIQPPAPCPLSFTASELSEDSYEDERVYEEEGSEVNSEDSDIQEVLPVPNAWASLGKKGKIG